MVKGGGDPSSDQSFRKGACPQLLAITVKDAVLPVVDSNGAAIVLHGRAGNGSKGWGYTRGGPPRCQNAECFYNGGDSQGVVICSKQRNWSQKKANTKYFERKAPQKVISHRFMVFGWERAASLWFLVFPERHRRPAFFMMECSELVLMPPHPRNSLWERTLASLSSLG